MDLLIVWILLPLLLAALCLGLGLLVERATGEIVPGALLVPIGYAVLVVVGQFTTLASASAPFTTPIVVVLGLAGLVLARRRLRALRPDPWLAAAALGVFAVFAAPVAFSGQLTWSGYNVTGDTSFEFVGADVLIHHARNFAELAPSTFTSYAEVYYGRFYPAGAQVGVGIAHQLVGQDVAFVYQPYLSFLAMCLALALGALAGTFLESRVLRAAVAFLAGQSALVLGYVLQGQIKETAATAMIPLIAALAAVFIRQRPVLARASLPLAVAVTAAVAVIGPVAGGWAAPLALACLVAAVRVRGRLTWRPAVPQALVFAVAVGVLAIPLYRQLHFYFTPATSFLSNQNELGNLVLTGPLNRFQAFGIWLSGDYRALPDPRRNTTFMFIGLALASGVLGLLWAARRRAAWPALVFVAVSILVGRYLIHRGSPYADGKTLMIVSPAIVFAVALGVPAARDRVAGRLVPVLLFAALATGVLWSNALAYHSANLAPHARFAELARVGQMLEGQGPTLYTEFDEFDKHFLRDAQAEGASEAYKPLGSGLRDGSAPAFGHYYDLDAYPLAYVEHFSNVLLRRGPATARPPANYRLAYSGEFYEVWKRTPGPAPTDHLSLGDRFQPGGIPRCRVVQRLAAGAARSGARLAYVERPRAPMMVPAKSSFTSQLAVSQYDPFTLSPYGPGRVDGRVRVPQGGRFFAWIQGSFGRGVSVQVDGRPLGKAAYQLNSSEAYAYLGRLQLQPGVHSVTLVRGGGSLAPGNGGLIRSIGPVIFMPVASAQRTVRYLPATEWKSLCGTAAPAQLDWIEAIR